MASTADEWALKGEGNANIVFAYTGANPELAGRVLRLRKANPKGWAAAAPSAALAEIEAQVWEPVIPEWRRFGPAEREAAFLSRCLAPLLGSAAAGAAAAATALLQGSSSKSGAAAAGAQPSPLPPQEVQRLLLAKAGATAAAANASSTSTDAAATTTIAAAAAQLLPDYTLPPPDLRPDLPRVGQSICVEVKPKSGAHPPPAAHVGAAHAHLKLRVPRFALHQLLKHLGGTGGGGGGGGGRAMSRYNPRALFSGAPRDQEAAIAALLEAPCNNLKVFVNGAPAALGGGCKEEDGAAAAAAAALGAEGGQPGSPTRAIRRASAAALLAALRGFPVPAAAVDKGSSIGGGSENRTMPDAERERLLCRVVARALRASGALPRLLAAQSLDLVDVEGAAPLLERLLEEAGRGGGGGEGCEEASAAEPTTPLSPHPLGLDAPALARAAAAAPGVGAIPRAAALQLLRGYLAAATAKDCALMVTLQQVAAPAAEVEVTLQRQQVQDAEWERAIATAAAAAATAAKAEEAERAALIVAARAAAAAAAPDISSGLLVDAPSGCAFVWSVSLVDLDLKPLAKVAAHKDLDARITATALAHPQLLAAASEARRRWLRAWHAASGEEACAGVGGN